MTYDLTLTPVFLTAGVRTTWAQVWFYSQGFILMFVMNYHFIYKYRFFVSVFHDLKSIRVLFCHKIIQTKFYGYFLILPAFFSGSFVSFCIHGYFLIPYKAFLKRASVVTKG